LQLVVFKISMGYFSSLWPTVNGTKAKPKL
jgi:hypothetical protein